MVFHGGRLAACLKKLVNTQYIAKWPWESSSLKMRIAENSLYLITWTLVLIYLSHGLGQKLGGLAIIAPALIACILNCFCLNYNETPCNASLAIVIKIITFLRLVISFSVILKADDSTEWDWSTAFWPYWCSFAIQGIFGIASFIVFINSILNWIKGI